MDTAFTSTLKSNKGLGEYEKLTENYSIKEILVPPQGHTQHNEAQASYNNFTRIIRDHLLKTETIKKSMSPKVYKCMIKNQLEKDSFEILTRIIINGSPQLGGDDRDLGEYVRGFIIEDGEELVEFYIKTL